MLDNFNVSLCEHFFAQFAIVGLVVDYSLDTSLNDHLRAQLARIGGCVNCGSHSPVSSGFHDSGLLCVKAGALVEVYSLLYIVITSLATSLVAVKNSKGCPVVPC